MRCMNHLSANSAARYKHLEGGTSYEAIIHSLGKDT